MIFRMFNLKIDASDRDEFVKVGRHNLTTSLANEPGTLTMYATHADPAGTDNYIFEVYQDENAYDIHAHSPQFKDFTSMAKDVIKGRSVTQLVPQLLLEQPAGFTVEDGQSTVQLNKATLPSAELKTLLPKLRQAVSNDPHFLACLVGVDKESPEQVVLLANHDSAGVAHQYADLLPGKAINLYPDTIISHGGLDFEAD